MATDIELGGGTYRLSADKRAALNLDSVQRSFDEGGDITRISILIWSMMGRKPRLDHNQVAELLIEEDTESIQEIAKAVVAEQKSANSPKAKKKPRSSRSSALKSD